MATVEYTLFLDETGDHTLSPSEDIGKRYLGLAGPIVTAGQYNTLCTEIDHFRKHHLPCTNGLPVLHRKEIMQARSAFSCLHDPEKRRAFDLDLLRILKVSPYKLIGVVIDKAQHGKKTYRRLAHPYHYCLHAILERFCAFLSCKHSTGRVSAEARGTTEDTLLQEAYRKVRMDGTRYLSARDAQSTLPEEEIQLKKKQENIIGLQIADLVAHPVTRDILLSYGRIETLGSPFAEQAAKVLRLKYYRNEYTGRIQGFGKIFLS